MVADNKSDVAKQFIDRFNRLKADRGTLDAHLQEVADRAMPRKSNILSRDTPGAKKGYKRYDDAMALANQYMAAGFVSSLCPPDKEWHRIKAKAVQVEGMSADDFEALRRALKNSERVKNWCQEVSRITHEELSSSNFYLEIHELFLDLGWCGTPCIHVDEGIETALSFTNHHISEYYIAEDSRGRVDTVFRQFEYTARQAVQKWGKKLVGQAIRDAYANTKEIDKKFLFLHVVYPRAERQYGKIDRLNQPIASVYIDVKRKTIITEGGYREMPKMVPRFAKGSGEVWGYSPGMFVLGTMKILEEIVKATVRGAQKTVDPVIMMADDGFVGPVKLIPGGIVNVRQELWNQGMKPDIWPVGDVRLGLDMEEQRREVIKQAHFNDIFMMMSRFKKNPKMVVEAMEMISEKRVVLGPVVGRLQSELFNPLITRAISILGRAGKLPPIPPELAGQEYEIEYISTLALAMKLTEIDAFRMTMEDLEGLLEGRPEILDNFDLDKAARGVAERRGTPVDFVRPEDDVIDIRQARAEKEQAQQAILAAREVAGAAKDLQGKTEEGSPLEALMGV